MNVKRPQTWLLRCAPQTTAPAGPPLFVDSRDDNHATRPLCLHLQEESRMTKSQPRTMWYFYPTFGLDLTDETDDTKTPLFTDCTILSMQHLRALLSKTGDEGVSNYYRNHAPEMLSGVLGVRLISRRPHESPGHDDPLETRAAARARQVAALIGIAFLVVRHSHFGLLDDWYIKGRNLVVLNASNREWSMRELATGMPIGGRPSASGCVRLARHELLQVLEVEPVCSLTRILAPSRRVLEPTLQQVITQTAIRLSSAACASDPCSHILSAVTCLELLLSERMEGFATLQRRTECLVGKDNARIYGLAKILEARHRYVHAGEDLELRSVKLSWNALLLGTLCLIKYAELTRHFRSKPALLTYLDFVGSGEEFLPSWPTLDQEAFRSLVKHERTRAGLPCFVLAGVDPPCPTSDKAGGVVGG